MKQEQLEHLYEIGNEETKKYLEAELSYKRPFRVGDFLIDNENNLLLVQDSWNDFIDVYNFTDGTKYSWRKYQGWCRLATDKEIEKHLINEAELKGYKEGVEVKVDDEDRTSILDSDSTKWTGEYLYVGGVCVWRKSDNTWAKIIEHKKWSCTQVTTRNQWVVTDGHDEYIFGNNEKAAKDVCEYLNSKEKE